MWQTIIRLSLCFLSLIYVAVAQITTPLEVVSKAKIPKDVEKLVSIGGPNDGIECDAEGNLWIPGARGYSSTVSSLVRYRPGEAKLHLDIDRTPKLKGGSIEFFRPLEEGGVIALVRTVREYDKFNNPKTYRDSFAVIFDPAGAIASLTELKLPSSADSVTALARLKLGWLLAGYTHDTTSIDLQVFLFDEAGGFIKQVMPPEGRQKASRTGSVESSTVFRPTALSTVDGDILLFRGFSNQPIYRFSLTGKLKQTIKLQPNGIDFWSPRLLGDDLFVQAAIEPEKLGVGSGIPGVPLVRKRSVFPVFDLKTGKIIQVMTWMDDGTVGCFNGTRLLIVKHDRESDWEILTLEPKTIDSGKPKS